MTGAGGWGRRLVGWIRAMSAATPLRVKLIAALLVLVTLGLTATGVAGVYALRGYLVDRVDNQLLDITARYAHQQITSCDLPDNPARLTGFFMQLSGNVNCTSQVLSGRQTVPTLPTMNGAELARHQGVPFTVGASDGGRSWRVLVLPVVDGSGNPAGSMAIALNLQEVDQTVGRLVTIEVVVGAIVLFVLWVLGYTAIRSSLRPLLQVEATAAAIAGGDLTRRVPRAAPRTEVGRLASALNGMLAQIETAFAEREEAAARAGASEARMRRFVADASHELRTPLTVVRGFAELLRQQSAGKEKPGSNVLVASNRIEQAATRMGLLVEDMLMLARLDQQRPLEARPVDLLALGSDAVSEARVAAPDHPVTLTLTGSAETGPPVVLGDEAKLRQVIGNLLSNAVQHTPPGTAVTVSVGTEAGTAVLEVADNGPGLRPEDAARIFERFYRVDTARPTGGAGLGLSIVDSIVTAHGGSVAVRTAPGEGARIRVTLPLLDPDQAVSAEPAPGETASADPQFAPEPGRIAPEPGRGAAASPAGDGTRS